MTFGRKTKRNDAAQIFFAKRAAERLIERATAERGDVVQLSRDELAAFAQQALAACTIAERLHLEKAQAGSLPPDAFPGPVNG